MHGILCCLTDSIIMWMPQMEISRNFWKGMRFSLWLSLIHISVTEGCNVRAEASDESEIIGGLDEGTQVEKTGQEGDWIQIDYEGQTGYVFSSLLE